MWEGFLKRGKLISETFPLITRPILSNNFLINFPDPNTPNIAGEECERAIPVIAMSSGIHFGVDRIILSGAASKVDTINIASCTSPDERGLGNSLTHLLFTVL